MTYFFEIVSAAMVVWGIVTVLVAFILWFLGIIPALYRLGNGLAKREIAVFAKGDNLNSLRALLVDSKIFWKSNISEITSTKDIDKAVSASVFLVYWPDWAGDIEKILSRKPDQCPLIVYAPMDMGRIPPEQMKALDGKRNTAVTNFRGRLLNDLVTSMITTGYGKK